MTDVGKHQQYLPRPLPGVMLHLQLQLAPLLQHLIEEVYQVLIIVKITVFLPDITVNWAGFICHICTANVILQISSPFRTLKQIGEGQLASYIPLSLFPHFTLSHDDDDDDDGNDNE